MLKEGLKMNEAMVDGWLTSNLIDKAHRMGPPRTPRNTIFHVTNLVIKSKIWENKKHLAPADNQFHHISINHDLTRINGKHNKAALFVCVKMRKHANYVGKTVRISQQNIFVDNVRKHYTEYANDLGINLDEL